MAHASGGRRSVGGSIVSERARLRAVSRLDGERLTVGYDQRHAWVSAPSDVRSNAATDRLGQAPWPGDVRCPARPYTTRVPP